MSSKFTTDDHVRVTNPALNYFDRTGVVSGQDVIAGEAASWVLISGEDEPRTFKQSSLTLADPELIAPLRVYLAGPMTGIAEYNFPAFKAAAAYLRTYGYEVFNPAENDLENGFDATGLAGNEAEQHGFSLRNALKQDLSWICDNANFIALLDGHHASKGVAAELALATALDIPVLHFTRFNGGTPA